MSGNMPELGSKISLISKADIRYEGRLFTVDPNECTIALASVRSFGTEDRETQFPIAAQNQVYDYILFRGSDIKDIRVCNTAPVPNDPAIMQMHLPQVLQPGNPFQTPHFPMVNMLPGSGGPMGQFGAPGTGGPPYGMGQNLQPGNNLMGNPQQQPPQQQGSVNQAVVGPNNNNISGGGAGDLGGLLVGAGGGGNVVGNNAGPGMLVGIIGSGPGQQQHQQQQQQQVQQQQKNQSGGNGGSRSTTPHSMVSRKSPSADMGVQVNQGGAGGSRQQQPDQKRNNMQQQQQQSQMRNQQQQQGYQQRDRRDSGRNTSDDKSGTSQGQLQQQNQGNRSNYNKNFPNQQRQMYHSNNIAQQGNNRSGGPPGTGWVQRGGNQMMRGGRGRMNNRNMNNQQFRQPGPNMKPRNPGKSIKFDSDYDFEQANNKFEELRTQLAKLKVADGAAPDVKIEPQVNGDGAEVVVPVPKENEKKEKDDSGNETGAGEQEPEEGEDGAIVGYDKTKSFFDNISCEAQTDRKGKPRVDWRQERKLNSETFGVSSTRRGGQGGGYRGRGGGMMHNNNAGGGGGYYRNGNNNNNNSQGGYRQGGGGYRNNYRRHNNMRMNSNGTNPNSTGIPTPKQGPSGPSAAAAPPPTVAAVVAAAQ